MTFPDMKHASARCAEAAFLWLLLSSALLLAVPARAELVLLDRIAVIVDNEVIMESDVRARLQEVQAQIAARGVAAPPVDDLRRQVVERLILESVQSQLGGRMGVRVDDETLNSALAGIARQNGLGLREFVEKLRSEGVDYAVFREQVRTDIVNNRVRQRRVGERVRITDADVEEFLRSAAARDLFATSYRLAHILVGLPEVATADEVAEAQKKAERLLAEARGGADFAELAVRNSDATNALEGGDLGWRSTAQLPSLFSSAVADMNPGDIAGPLRSASGFHVVKLVERKGDGQKIVQQARVRHVLVKPSAIRSPEEAREFVRTLRERVVQGEDFAAIARRHSEDPGSALAGGDLGWVSAGQMVDEFEAVMNTTETGTLSGIFETPFGWHFLQVQERRDQDASEEYRRLQARNALWKRKFDAELENWLRELRSEAYVEIKNP
ncbi:MAG: peptidylprolyl isomerase [Gammaproteobacteria bacterium]